MNWKMQSLRRFVDTVAAGPRPSAMIQPTAASLGQLPNLASGAQLLDRVVGPDTQVWVNGSDYYSNNADWLKMLAVWLDRGATINYLLLHPSAERVCRIAGLQQRKPRASLRLRVIDDGCQVPEADVETVRKMHDFGFVVADRPAFLMVHRHPASDVCEVVLTAAVSDPRYLSLKRIIEDVWNTAAPVNVAAPVTRVAARTVA
jgi:hypothetical protein